MATTAEMLTAVKQMNIMDLVGVVKTLEEEFGIVFSGPMAPTVGPGPIEVLPLEEEEKQTEFGVRIKEVGQKKVGVIKAVREVTLLGLREAKALVESHHPMVKEGIPRDEAESISRKLEEAGATAEIS